MLCGFPDRLHLRYEAKRILAGAVGNMGTADTTNLRIILPSFSISDTYPRTIEPAPPILLVSLSIERADCR
jgi:hypothetical protein